MPSLTVSLRLQPELSVSAELAKIMQQGLACTSLRTVTAAVEAWYDPDPQSNIIEEDQVFVEAIFAIPDEEMERQLHFTVSVVSPWFLRLEMDRAKMIDRKLTMEFVTNRIKENFKSGVFVIWSEDNSEKLILRCRILGGAENEGEDGIGAIEEGMFTSCVNRRIRYDADDGCWHQLEAGDVLRRRRFHTHILE
jgi:DNA-directed RNA polymerase II subunit RPB1